MVTASSWINFKNRSSQLNDPLHSLLEAIQARFASSEHVDRSLVSLLNSLCAHLQMHFEWDESDISLAGIDVQAPQLSCRIEQLKTDQYEVLHDLSVLIGLARIALAEKQDIRPLAERFHALQAKFAHYEAIEKRLFQEAITAKPALNG